MRYIKLFAMVIISAGVILSSLSSTKQRDLRNYAAEITPEVPVRGQMGDLWADIIIGKPTFNEIVAHTVTAGKTFFPRSVIIDRSNPTSNKMYVYDGGNSRIIGIDVASCLSHSGNPLNCSADLIIGQPASHPGDSGYGSTAACNGDSAYQRYPARAPASSSSLCSLPESQLSVEENGTGSNMVTDAQGNLYVTDSYNNRVLKYPSPFLQQGTISANDVWGQNDFTGNQCNKNQSNPDNSTLCFGWSGNNNMSAGVEIDTNGNMWVADSGNNRVLRFPAGSHTADMVIGQSTFTTKTFGTGLNQLYAPTAIRFTSDGKMLVADHSNNRIMIYTAPFVNGISGQIFAVQGDFASPSGLTMDPLQTDRVWITNQGHYTVELWDIPTQTLVRTIGRRGDGNVVNSPSGSIAIDTTGNVYIGIKGANYGNDVIQYPVQGPYDYPAKSLFGGTNIINQRDQYGLYGANQVVIAGGQLIVSDGAGVKFWNVDSQNPVSSLSNGKPADGYIIQSSFSSQSAKGSIFAMKASDTHLYVARSRRSGPNGTTLSSGITIYPLPLSTGQTVNESQSISLPLNVLGGGQIIAATNDDQYWSVAPARDNSYIWISDANNSRVFRVRNPLTAPLVDVILGQNSTSGILCNRTGNPVTDATSTSLCWPGWVSVDKQQNIYVSDWSPENRGNWRLLVYNNTLFPANNQSIIYAPSASKIFINTAVAELAFDSQNRMVAGYQRYYNLNPSGYAFPGIYVNPLAPAPVPPAQIQPDNHLKDFSSAAFAVAFDNTNNLYVGDWSRNRVHVYLNPLTVVQPTISPTATVTPTFVPTATPTITPSALTPTPTPDRQSPTVTITSPLNGASVSRNANITIHVSAYDNVGIARVVFYVNNVQQSTDTSSPYSYVWKVPTKKGATYTLRVNAYDLAQNSRSHSITVVAK